MATMRGTRRWTNRPITPQPARRKRHHRRRDHAGDREGNATMRSSVTSMMGTLRAAALALAALVAVLGPAWGQAPYPNQPVRLVIAFGPGGVADTTSRLVA